VIHEVGHNFFPMIVNSDERQWTWMDEGPQHLPAVPGRAGVGERLSLLARRARQDRELHGEHRPGADHDQLRFAGAVRQQRLSPSRRRRSTCCARR
jgi:hypothetical protein